MLVDAQGVVEGKLQAAGAAPRGRRWRGGDPGHASAVPGAKGTASGRDLIHPIIIGVLLQISSLISFRGKGVLAGPRY